MTEQPGGARALEGRPVADAIWAEVEPWAAALAARRGYPPTLAVVRVGVDPAMEAYARQIGRAFARHGLDVRSEQLPAGARQTDLDELIDRLNADPRVDGMVLQQPLPAPLDSVRAVERLRPDRDVEGLHPLNAGRLVAGQPGYVPSTPLAGLELLRFYGIPIAGRRVTVVGRSRVVGLPMALLLLREHATVTIAHSRTPDLAAVTREAEVLVTAVGRPRLVGASMVRPGAVIVDFGTTPVDGRLVGDVDYEAARQVAGAITPVPGGTGPVTTAVLARNVIVAAEGGP